MDEFELSSDDPGLELLMQEIEAKNRLTGNVKFGNNLGNNQVNVQGNEGNNVNGNSIQNFNNNQPMNDNNYNNKTNFNSLGTLNNNTYNSTSVGTKAPFGSQINHRLAQTRANNSGNLKNNIIPNSNKINIHDPAFFEISDDDYDVFNKILELTDSKKGTVADKDIMSKNDTIATKSNITKMDTLTKNDSIRKSSTEYGKVKLQGTNEYFIISDDDDDDFDIPQELIEIENRNKFNKPNNTGIMNSIAQNSNLTNNNDNNLINDTLFSNSISSLNSNQFQHDINNQINNTNYRINSLKDGTSKPIINNQANVNNSNVQGFNRNININLNNKKFNLNSNNNNAIINNNHNATLSNNINNLTNNNFNIESSINQVPNIQLDQDPIFEISDDDFPIELFDQLAQQGGKPNQSSKSDNINTSRNDNSIKKKEIQTKLNFVPTKPNANKPSFNIISNYKPPTKCYEQDNCYTELNYCPEAIKTWVYPTNYPLRDYQFNIVMKALHENTLVSLPTGLGKTFIAAVVMFNFYRWFPDLKVVFMAPTKPLVAQQIESCYKVCGIDPKDCVELTGMTQRKLRQELWRSKKVFYITPQILENDLKEGLCSPEYFSLIVVDEAHRAQRAYAYVTVIKEIFKKNPLFRVLALSATPGSTMDKVQAMVTNLNIARIEIRTEEALDIMPYTFQKLVDKRVVPLSPIIEEISENFKNIFRPNLEKLKNKGAFWSTDLEQISHYSLLKARERFRANSHNGGMDSRLAEGDFALCISMVHQLEHLHKYGVTTFSKKIREWIEESKSSEAKYRHQMLNNLSFQKLVSKVEEIVQREDYHQKLMSHPKLELLINKVQEHFNLFDSNSKIMIFAQFRETINEIIQTLSKLGDHVRATPFIGQSDGKASKGLKQKEQIEVIQKFKRGEYNILVCSSIGEEGLDIGEVDFIICYDSTSSPIKLLQRIGRTGRRRDGKVCMLLSKGKEERSFYSSKSYHKTVVKAIQEGKVDYFQQNARMLPQGCIPICEKKNIHIEPYDRLIIKPTRGRGNKYNDNKYKNQLELEEELIDYQLNEDRISLDITKSMINRPTLYYSVKHTPLCYNVVKIFNQIQYLKIRQENDKRKETHLKSNNNNNNNNQVIVERNISLILEDNLDDSVDNDMDFELNNSDSIGNDKSFCKEANNNNKSDEELLPLKRNLDARMKALFDRHAKIAKQRLQSKNIKENEKSKQNQNDEIKEDKSKEIRSKPTIKLDEENISKNLTKSINLLQNFKAKNTVKKYINDTSFNNIENKLNKSSNTSFNEGNATFFSHLKSTQEKSNNNNNNSNNSTMILDSSINDNNQSIMILESNNDNNNNNNNDNNDNSVIVLNTNKQIKPRVVDNTKKLKRRYNESNNNNNLKNSNKNKTLLITNELMELEAEVSSDKNDFSEDEIENDNNSDENEDGDLKGFICQDDEISPNILTNNSSDFNNNNNYNQSHMQAFYQQSIFTQPNNEEILNKFQTKLHQFGNQKVGLKYVLKKNQKKIKEIQEEEEEENEEDEIDDSFIVNDDEIEYENSSPRQISISPMRKTRSIKRREMEMERKMQIDYLNNHELTSSQIQELFEDDEDKME